MKPARKENAARQLRAAVEKRIHAARSAIEKRVDRDGESAEMRDVHGLAIVDRVKLDTLCTIVVRSIQDAANELISDPGIRSAACVRLAAFWPLSWHEGKAATGEHDALLALDSSEDDNLCGPVLWPADITPEDLASALDGSNDARAVWLARALRRGIVERRIDGRDVQPTQFDGILTRKDLDALTLTHTAVCVARAVTNVRRDQRVAMTPISATHHANAALDLIRGSAPDNEAKRKKESNVSFVLDCGPYQKGEPRAQLEFAFQAPVQNASDAKSAILSILARDKESALHDWLALHVLASRNGGSGSFVWTWPAHREITRWGERIRSKNVTDRDARSQVEAWLRRLEKAILRVSLPNKKGGKDYVRMPGTLIEILAGSEDKNERLDAAKISINPLLYIGKNDPYFTHIPETALKLDAMTLRVCVALMLRARHNVDHGGTIDERAEVLWDMSGIEGRTNAKRDETFRRALDALRDAGIIETWGQDGRDELTERRFMVAPSAAWLDRTVLGIPSAPPMLALPQRVPLALPSSNVQTPLTGESLRAWRKSQGPKGPKGPKGITQRAAAQALGVSRESIIRAEKKTDESLSGSLLCALLAKGSR